MNETVATYILAKRLIHILNKIISKYFKKFLRVYDLYSYLDIFSLDNDSFDYQNVD